MLKNNKRVLIPKVKTWIYGLDDVLEGGIPEGRTTIISGGPGCGKSVLALEFLYYGVLEGEAGIFVTFEENKEAVFKNSMTFGWDLAELEKQGKFFLLEACPNPQMIISGDFNIAGLLAIIEGQSKALGAKRIVIDAVDVLLRIFNDPHKERNEFYCLHNWLNSQKMTAVMTVKVSQNISTPVRYEFLDFMADCVIYLDQRVTEQISTRRLRVTKYRGTPFGRNEYPYTISEEGLSIIPTSTTALRHKPLGDRISSGHPRLDAILGGGYRRASAILVAGTTGAGKSTMAATFIRGITKQKENVLYLGFEESQEAIIVNQHSTGIDLDPALKNGYLHFLTIMPESMGAEEHLFKAIKAIEKFSTRHVIVDAISACKRMGNEKSAFDYMIRLMNYCKERDITCMLLNQTDKPMDIHQISGVEISSMIDTAIFLGMVEVGGEVNRLLIVLKSRGSVHSNQFREFRITSKGIDIMDVYIGEGGVLTGAARQEQEAKESLENRRRQQILTKKRYEIAHKESSLQAHIANLKIEVEIAKAELDEILLEEEKIQKERKIRGDMRGKSGDDAYGQYFENKKNKCWMGVVCYGKNIGLQSLQTSTFCCR